MPLDPDAVAELLGLLREAIDRSRPVDAGAVLTGLLDPDVPLDGDAIDWATGWLRSVAGVGGGSGR